MTFSSKLIEDAVLAFAKLPGIGKKTALRMVLHLLKQDKEEVFAFSQAIATLKEKITNCQYCHNVSDSDTCNICSNSLRNNYQICVVESIRDIIAIESTQQYNGLYHVLGGILSPLDGIGPEQLHITSLMQRLQNQKGVQEIIMALNPTLEGDTTLFYISRLVQNLPIKITTLARGISFGGELEYSDELTLARSISKRLPIDSYISIESK